MGPDNISGAGHDLSSVVAHALGNIAATINGRTVDAYVAKNRTAFRETRETFRPGSSLGQPQHSPE